MHLLPHYVGVIGCLVELENWIQSFDCFGSSLCHCLCCSGYNKLRLGVQGLLSRCHIIESRNAFDAIYFSRSTVATPLSLRPSCPSGQIVICWAESCFSRVFVEIVRAWAVSCHSGQIVICWVESCFGPVFVEIVRTTRRESCGIHPVRHNLHLRCKGLVC